MRVLHIGKCFPPCPGGIETFVHDLLPALAARGVTVAAVVHHHERGAPTAREECKGVPITRVRTWGTVCFAPMCPSFPWQVRRLVREFRPDLLHVHVPNPSAFALLVPGVAGAAPILVQWHSDVVPSRLEWRLRLAYRFYRPLETRLLRRARHIVATSLPYLESSPTLPRYRGKCSVIPLGLDPQQYPEPDGTARAWAAAQWPASGLRVLCVGRFTYYKGHAVLVDALSRLPGAQACLVGSGELRERIVGRIAAGECAGRVRVLAGLSMPQVQAMLASCDCLCLPSVERTEAFGMVLLEAMRYGKACVVSNIEGSGPGWVVRHEQEGLHTAPGNVDQLTGALQRLGADAALLERLGRAGAARFEECFRIDRVAAQFEQRYRALTSPEDGTEGAR